MVEAHAQKFVLWAAISLTSVAILRVGLWPPPAPRPQELNPALLSPLQASNWSIRTKLSASDSDEVSSAGGFELINPVRHPGTVLYLVPVRTRGGESFTINTLMRPIVDHSPEKTILLRFGKHQRLRFPASSQAKTSSHQRLEAACISNGLAMASNQNLVRTELKHDSAKSSQQQIAQLLGLRQARNWDCLLVVVRQPNAANSSGVWTEALAALGSWDQKRG